MGDEIGLRRAADELGVHYMTAYRYVRSGRLPARKVRGEWQVDRDDLARLAQPERTAHDDAPRAVHRRRLEERLIAGDEAGAWGVVDAALASGASPSSVLTDMLMPSLSSIGERWAAGELAIADEHRASAVSHRLIARMGPRFARRGRRRGSVVLGSVAGDQHALPTAILSDLLRGCGLEVIDLGADCPAQVFVDAAERLGQPSLIGVCVTAPDLLAVATEVVDEVAAALPDCSVVLGGSATGDSRPIEQVVEDLLGRAEQLQRHAASTEDE